MVNRIFIFLLFVFLSASMYSQNIVEWRGINRSGIYPDQNLLKNWPEKGPTLLLEINDIGSGYSSPVVYRNQIFVTGKKDSLDVIASYKQDGTKNWETAYGRAWSRTFPETRCTPTIENNRIYLVSGMGEVCCVDAISGNILWRVDAQSKFNGEPHRWGIAESVAVSDKAVFYVTGGEETSVIALNKINGSLLWKTKSLGGTRAYASSVIIRKKELQLLLAQTANDLMAIDTENGEIIWSFHIVSYHTGESGVGANTNTPLVNGNDIFLTSGYNHPAIMLTMSPDGKSVSEKWQNPDFDNHIGGVVKVGDHIFGSNWLNNNSGNWMCVDWNSGKTNYESKWINKGSIISADGLLYCFEEKSGTIGLVRPNPEKFDLISTLKIKKGEGPYWAHPTIYDGKLLVRHGEYLAVFDLKN
jgi:outer membrane protein assembly factor BamB